jgi:two-component system response regulator YesN
MKKGCHFMKVLIVDDQKLSRARLRVIIEWDRLGLELAAECTDGEDALAYLQEHPCDIVITDVRMPSIDGLTLVEKASEICDHLSFIIVSGYDDFVMLRKSILLYVSDYILKPVDPLLLNETLDRVVTSKHKELEKYKAYKRFENEQFILQLVAHNFEGREQMINHYTELGIGLPTWDFCPVLLKIDTTIDPIVTCMSQLEFTSYVIIPYKELYLLVLSYPEMTVSLIGNIIATLDSNGSIHHCLVGPCTSGLESLADSIEVTSAAYYNGLELSLFDNKETVWYERLPHTPYRYGVNASLEANWISSLRKGYSESSEQYLVLILGSLPNRMDESLNDLLTYLLHRGVRELLSMDYLNQNVFGEITFSSKCLRSLTSIAKKKEHILTFFRNLQSQWKQEDSKDVAQLVKKVQSYIDTHFTEQISLSDLAQSHFISLSRLSTSFRQIIGMNFIDYLSQVRVNHAKKLLAHSTEIRIQTLAEMCGFQDIKHFRMLFKKYTGFTPLAYKEQTYDK